jgi:hypothetical protein
MPLTSTQPPLPFQGATPRSRHTGYKAALAEAPKRETKTARYFAWLCAVGQATDEGAAEALGYRISTICSIRNGLVRQLKVAPLGEARGSCGVAVTIWHPRVPNTN